MLADTPVLRLMENGGVWRRTLDLSPCHLTLVNILHPSPGFLVYNRIMITAALTGSLHGLKELIHRKNLAGCPVLVLSTHGLLFGLIMNFT